MAMVKFDSVVGESNLNLVINFLDYLQKFCA